MNLKLTLAFVAATVTTAAVAQNNILDVRENYNIGDVVTVTGVVTSDDNLGFVLFSLAVELVVVDKFGLWVDLIELGVPEQ